MIFIAVDAWSNSKEGGVGDMGVGGLVGLGVVVVALPLLHTK